MDIRDFEFMGIDDNGMENVLVATDGGITLCKLDIQDHTVVERYNLNGNHLPICEFVGMGIYHSEPQLIVAGAMHDHSHRFENGQWSYFNFGDGGDCEVNWLDPSIYYYMGNRSMNSSSASNFSYSNPGQWFIGMEYELNPNNPYLLYFGRGKQGSNAILGFYNEQSEELTTKQVPAEVSKVGAIGVNSDDEIYVADFVATYGTTPNRFIKSLDNGDTWIDLSTTDVYTSDKIFYNELGPFLAWKTVEDIVFNPNNPYEMWITIGGVRTNNGIPENGKFRILHSTDGGSFWYDYSEGLTAFPVMALEYQTGSNNRLFAGTDAGIYYRDPSMNQWECFSEGLPIAIITDLDYDPCSKYLYASAYSRSIFKTYVSFEDNMQTIISDANEIWDSPIEIANDVVIQANAKLTINSEVYMSKGKKIIVEPNGKLIINNGTITNRCNQPWAGIEVWGNSSTHQYADANGNYQQGYVELNNGAVIENAWEAIQPWNPQHWDQTGGIIKANGATFRNNRRAVQFIKYENYDPATNEHRPNQSKFSNCTFETTSDFDEMFGESPFHTFVSMYKVDGVKFYSCDFEDARTGFYDPQPENQAVGIWTIDANFYVLQNITPSTFTGLNMGVYSSQSGTVNTFVIDQANFTNNLYGVYNVTNNQASCIRSTFVVGGKQTTAPFYMPTGIFNYASTGFTFDQNNFSPDNNLNPLIDFHTGIWNLYTGDDENIIFKNNFSGMGNANLAGGDNHNNDWPEKGLIYKCNTNTNNVKYDFRTYGGEGIASYQGSEELAAGNTFGHLTFPEGSDFANQATWPVNYYYYTGNSDEVPVNEINVWKKGAPQNSCVDKYSIGSDIRLTEAEKDFYRQQYFYNKAEYDNTKYLYEDLKDGGDTPGTKLDVETAWPDETWELRALLLADSPHLSLDVLYAAADKPDVLPHTIMFEICIANPEEMRNEEFLNYLETKEDPMPSYMVDDLREGADEDTYKSVLQNEMAGYVSLWGEACNYLLRDIVLDSTGIKYDSLRLWLGNKESLNGAYEIVDSYMAQDSLTAAMSYLSDIPNNFDLSIDQLTEYDYLYDLKNILSQS